MRAAKEPPTISSAKKTLSARTKMVWLFFFLACMMLIDSPFDMAPCRAAAGAVNIAQA